VSGPASGDAVHGRRVRALRAAVAVCEGLAASCRPLDIVPCSDLGRMSASVKGCPTPARAKRLARAEGSLRAGVGQASREETARCAAVVSED
jgi:hypothetical protein